MYNMIDPPVGPYSDPDEIRLWLDRLRDMEQTDPVRQAITEAEAWLAQREAAHG